MKIEPTKLIRKHANELKVHEKTVKTAIKQGLNPLGYAIWGVLKSKTGATSYPNIGSLKTAIEEKWNKMSEEFLLKVCKSFRKRVNAIIGKKMMSKFTVLCLFSYFVVHFLYEN